VSGSTPGSGYGVYDGPAGGHFFPTRKVEVQVSEYGMVWTIWRKSRKFAAVSSGGLEHLGYFSIYWE